MYLAELPWSARTGLAAASTAHATPDNAPRIRDDVFDSVLHLMFVFIFDVSFVESGHSGDSAAGSNQDRPLDGSTLSCANPWEISLPTIQKYRFRIMTDEVEPLFPKKVKNLNRLTNQSSGDLLLSRLGRIRVRGK